ncbi:esterase [Mycobacterium sp. MS1601]|uniref:alpha/beta hydrolase n=1 Tax=Mycobacterium sp. MS1601 TaxID=1936029 RepID=UPI0009790BA2|nr:alpha/beta hydrolase [Mycobacterium sp. MS1601]AQA03560.1 esterase [Mycobacterium sp. MS1601]
MARLTLLRAAVELANAANGVRPLARKGYVTIPVFFLGWPTSEMAPLYLTGSVLDAVRRGTRGDFRGAQGRIALGVTAAAWVLLVLIQRRNVRSEPIFEAALRDSLGDDYHSVASASQPARKHAGVFATGWSRRRYVKKLDTVRYGPHGRANLADIWHRSDLPLDGKAPVLLQVPGGAWSIGMRRPQAYPLLSHLAERGWICVSMAYRVSPRNSWPDHIVDVKRALAWIKENIADYGGDPDFVAISGGSAGGHLTALAALTPGDPQWQPGFEDADTSVVAAVPVYGRYDWHSTRGEGRPQFIKFLQKFVTKTSFRDHHDVYVDASPINRLRSDAPPFFILHGTDDSIIPVTEGREFVDELRKVSGSTVAYCEVPHAQHAFDFFGSPRGHYTAEAIERFLSWVHAKS